jgi:hypothetical protein
MTARGAGDREQEIAAPDSTLSGSQIDGKREFLAPHRPDLKTLCWLTSSSIRHMRVSRGGAYVATFRSDSFSVFPTSSDKFLLRRSLFLRLAFSLS